MDTQDDEQGAYVRAIEERFRSWRGRPLLLSPADFRVALEWHELGIPLWLVESVLDDLFKRAREDQRPGPRSLRYCRSAVTDSWRSWKVGRVEAGAPQEQSPPSVELFEAARQALERSRAPESVRLATLQQLSLLNAREAISIRVSEIDAALLEACLQSLGDDEKSALRERARQDLLPWAADMTEATRAQAFERALARRTRERFDLPDLTLLALSR